jgi:hypothetical protein
MHTQPAYRAAEEQGIKLDRATPPGWQCNHGFVVAPGPVQGIAEQFSSVLLYTSCSLLRKPFSYPRRLL